MQQAAGNAGARLSADAMRAKAAAQEGLDDFGGEEFLESLHQLVQLSNEAGVLSPIGFAALEADLHRILVNRLRFTADLKRHPEILDEDVSDPIIILGMPRTGTTKLQRMIAADPDVQRLYFWRLLNPAPFPSAEPGAEDPRIEEARQAVALMHRMMPDWKRSHSTNAEEVDEEAYLQMFTCKSMITAMGLPVPAYLEWFRTQPLRDTYLYMKQLLQYLQWQDGGKRGRPWILKSPVHLATIDLLMALFPKATFVHTHREITTTVASVCRLMQSGWVLYLDSVDPHKIGRAVMRGFIEDLKTHMQLRERLGTRLAILDVQYESVRNDSMKVIEAIYQRAGRELTDERRRSMREWEAAHPQHVDGKPTYRLEDYGITREQIDRECRDYIERHNTQSVGIPYLRM
jgi:Sulfotransferase family